MSEFEIPIGSLEEQALKRKERLKNLKRKAETKDVKQNQQTDSEKVKLPTPTEVLKIAESEEANDNHESTAVELKNDDVVSKMAKELVILKTPLVIDEIDLQNLAPRKPDWDLKRDVAKKLETLERRTQRSIAEIIRERLRTNQNDVDLQAVNTVGYSTQTIDE